MSEAIRIVWAADCRGCSGLDKRGQAVSAICSALAASQAAPLGRRGFEGKSIAGVAGAVAIRQRMLGRENDSQMR